MLGKTFTLSKPLMATAIGFVSIFALGLGAWLIRRRQSAAIAGGNALVHRGFLIQQRSTGGYQITRKGRTVAPYAFSVNQAKHIIDTGGLRGLEAARISTKIPAEMTASQINKELDRIDAERSKINEKLIAAGRGSETYNETYKKNDPLAQEFRALSDRRSALQIEIHSRMGPGHPSRIPSGRFWASPRKKPGVDGLGIDMLATIARESRSPEEFALRAEAWAATESKPPSDKAIARAYGKQTDTVLKLIRKARAKRQANTKSRFQALIRQPTEAMDGLGARPSMNEIKTDILQTIELQAASSSYGKKLTACDPAAMKSFAKDVANNLSMGVDLMIDDSLEDR